MSNNIFDLNENLDYSQINLGNPTLINNNIHFSKLTHGNLNKNIYIQFPKCITKNGIVKTSNKTTCELNYNMGDRNVIEFFEKLEGIILDKIYKNKELWFYDSSDLQKEDIEDLMSPIIKPFKNGKQFLVKTYIKSEKFFIYDENENKIDLSEYKSSSEIIPLLNINGIKFSSKNFTLELILSQIMILYPPDEFEKQILIKSNNYSKQLSSNVCNKKNDNILEEDKNIVSDEKDISKMNLEDLANKETLEINNNINKNRENINLIEESVEEENKENVIIIEKREEEENKENVNLIEKNEKEENKENINIIENSEEQENIEEIQENDKNINLMENNDKDLEIKINDLEENNNNNNKNTNSLLMDYNNDNPLLIEDIKLESINDKSNSIILKTHDEIYLEIYKNAKKKAKEIRKNAIEAFLEAKNIKNKYNLDHIPDSDSSEDEDNFIEDR